MAYSRQNDMRYDVVQFAGGDVSGRGDAPGVACRAAALWHKPPWRGILYRRKLAKRLCIKACRTRSKMTCVTLYSVVCHQATHKNMRGNRPTYHVACYKPFSQQHRVYLRVYAAQRSACALSQRHDLVTLNRVVVFVQTRCRARGHRNSRSQLLGEMT